MERKNAEDVPEWLSDIDVRPTAGIKTLFIPEECVGPLIGKGGEVINAIRNQSNSQIQIEFAYNPDGQKIAKVTLTGNVDKCEKLITDRLQTADRVAKIVDDIPDALIGSTIGPGGRNMAEIRDKSGCWIAFVSANQFDGSADPTRQVCRIWGAPHMVPTAERMLRAKVAEALAARSARGHEDGKGAKGEKGEKGSGKASTPSQVGVADRPSTPKPCTASWAGGVRTAADAPSMPPPALPAPPPPPAVNPAHVPSNPGHSPPPWAPWKGDSTNQTALGQNDMYKPFG